MPEKLFVGLDVHKRNVSVGVAEEGRCGEVRFIGDFENSPVVMNSLIKKLTKQGQQVNFCYEAGPCGYRPPAPETIIPMDYRPTMH